MNEHYKITNEQLILLENIKYELKEELFKNFLFSNVVQICQDEDLNIQNLEFYMHGVLKDNVNRYEISTLQRAQNHKYFNPIAKPGIDKIISGLELDIEFNKEIGIGDIPKISTLKIWLYFLLNQKELTHKQIEHTVNIISQAHMDEVNNLNS